MWETISISNFHISSIQEEAIQTNGIGKDEQFTMFLSMFIFLIYLLILSK